jgi:hypothetical protein
MKTRDAIQCELAGLAALESTVRLALRALYATYPDIARRQRDDDRIETARGLVEVAEDLLNALDHHRSYVLFRFAELGDPEQTAWPF